MLIDRALCLCTEILPFGRFSLGLAIDPDEAVAGNQDAARHLSQARADGGTTRCLVTCLKTPEPVLAIL